MNCWKSFNITKDHGSIRLVILSIISMVTFFILFNIAVTTFLNDAKAILFNPFILLVCLLLVLPIHKVMHCLPLWTAGRKAHLTFERSILLPVLNCHFKQPISKRLCLMVMSTPAFLGTILTIGLTGFMPSGMDYFGTMGAINFGLCAADFIYILNLLNAPRHAVIEDDQDGCKILVRQTY